MTSQTLRLSFHANNFQEVLNYCESRFRSAIIAICKSEDAAKSWMEVALELELRFALSHVGAATATGVPVEIPFAIRSLAAHYFGVGAGPSPFLDLGFGLQLDASTVAGHPTSVVDRYLLPWWTGSAAPPPSKCLNKKNLDLCLVAHRRVTSHTHTKADHPVGQPREVQCSFSNATYPPGTNEDLKGYRGLVTDLHNHLVELWDQLNIEYDKAVVQGDVAARQAAFSQILYEAAVTKDAEVGTDTMGAKGDHGSGSTPNYITGKGKEASELFRVTAATDLTRLQDSPSLKWTVGAALTMDEVHQLAAATMRQRGDEHSGYVLSLSDPTSQSQESTRQVDDGTGPALFSPLSGDILNITPLEEFQYPYFFLQSPFRGPEFAPRDDGGITSCPSTSSVRQYGTFDPLASDPDEGDDHPQVRDPLASDLEMGSLASDESGHSASRPDPAKRDPLASPETHADPLASDSEDGVGSANRWDPLASDLEDAYSRPGCASGSPERQADPLASDSDAAAGAATLWDPLASDSDEDPPASTGAAETWAFDPLASDFEGQAAPQQTAGVPAALVTAPLWDPLASPSDHGNESGYSNDSSDRIGDSDVDPLDSENEPDPSSSDQEEVGGRSGGSDVPMTVAGADDRGSSRDAEGELDPDFVRPPRLNPHSAADPLASPIDHHLMSDSMPESQHLLSERDPSLAPRDIEIIASASYLPFSPDRGNLSSSHRPTPPTFATASTRHIGPYDEDSFQHFPDSSSDEEDRS